MYHYVCDICFIRIICILQDQQILDKLQLCQSGVIRPSSPSWVNQPETLAQVITMVIGCTKHQIMGGFFTNINITRSIFCTSKLKPIVALLWLDAEQLEMKALCHRRR